MKKIVVKLLLLTVFTIADVELFAQAITDSTIKKIDAVFERWNTSTGPGCVIGIVQNDSVIFSKGYGLANLEYAIPNTPENIYAIASIAKQFTAYSIILLAKAGKLTLEDDIHKYFPHFRIKEKVTIRNLINHTSGIREVDHLLGMSGTRMQDVIYQGHVMKLLSMQEGLNFKPGDKYSYSNSGYHMLADIVQLVSGQSFRKFVDSAIFQPLGMTHSFVQDEYRDPIKNRSYGYEGVGGNKFRRGISNYAYSGAGNTFSTIADLSKWAGNLFNPKVGDRKDIQLLTTKGKLNNGKEISYAAGLFSVDYKGWTQYTHGGGDPGIANFFSIIPDLKLGFILLSNTDEINPYETVMKITDLFITEKKVNPLVITQKKDSADAVLANPKLFQKFTGTYKGDGGIIAITLENKRLIGKIFNNRFLLIPEGIDTFSILNNPGFKIAFNITQRDSSIDMQLPNDQTVHLIKELKFGTPTEKELQEFVGDYYSPELDIFYHVKRNGQRLYLDFLKYDDRVLTKVGPDHFTLSFWVDDLYFVRDSNKKINGFKVSSAGVKDLKFDKVGHPIK